MTLASCLTPPGTGAIATLAVRGPDAWALARALFRPRSASGRLLPDAPEEGRLWLGQFGADVADEVVLTVKATQPLPWVEIHCHGGREVVGQLLAALAERGATVCDGAEFLRATTNDALQALAAEALARAPTTRTAALLLDQYHGALRRALDALHETTPAFVERLAALAKYAPLGRHLVEPWRLVLAGPVNVGKSSLLNAIAGYQRSIVAATPGTTRDVVTLHTALDGWPVEMADTAGLREGPEELESQGIERARRAAAEADLVVWLLDASSPTALDATLPPGALPVINKVDLPSAWELDRVAGAVCVSARTGEGLGELCQAISRRLVPEPPPPGAALPFTPWLADRIEQAAARARAGDISEAQALLDSVRVGAAGGRFS